MSTTNVILVIVIVILIALFSRNSQKSKAAAGENRIKAAEFLAENAKKEGVFTTASGLQYEVLTQGKGETNPSAASKVKVHYHGTLADGTVFDSSVERNSPISFGLNQVIPGWTEGVQLMTEGSKFKFYISPDLGYGDRAAGKIPAGSLLIFEVELLKIES
jgi:peptidylprolyl isomerase